MAFPCRAHWLGSLPSRRPACARKLCKDSSEPASGSSPSSAAAGSACWACVQTERACECWPIATCSTCMLAVACGCCRCSAHANHLAGREVGTLSRRATQSDVFQLQPLVIGTREPFVCFRCGVCKSIAAAKPGLAMKLFNGLVHPSESLPRRRGQGHQCMRQSAGD